MDAWSRLIVFVAPPSERRRIEISLLRLGVFEQVITKKRGERREPPACCVVGPGRCLGRRSFEMGRVGHQLHVLGADEGDVIARRIHDSLRTWTGGPGLPGPAVEDPAAVALDDKLYVFGGSTSPFGGAVDNAAVFDPATGEWTSLAPMPTARGGATAQAVGGRIYVAGGMSSDGASLASVDVYDPALDSWSSAAAMGTRRDNPGSAVLDGKMYVFGGRVREADGTHTAARLSSVEMYEPDTDTWVPRAPMPSARRTMDVGVLDGRAVVIGGEIPTGIGSSAAVEEYDPATDSWRVLNPMLTPRHGAAAGTIGRVIYVVGGGPTGGGSFTVVNEAFSLGTTGGSP